MRILYLVPHVPNPTKARSYWHIRGLIQAGHHVTVATLIRHSRDRESVAALEGQGVQVIAERLPLWRSLASALLGVLTPTPFQVRFLWSAALWSAIQRYAADHEIDMVHVEHLRMGPYGLLLKRRYPVVWDAVDHLSSLYQAASRHSHSAIWRLVGLVESPRVRAYEGWLAGQFPLTLVITRADRELFRRENPQADSILVALPGWPIAPLQRGVKRADNVMVITGTMDYHPNVASVLYFVREVLPLIWKSRPDARLQIIGARPVKAIASLRDPRIEVLGFVPSLLEYVERATIAVAPLIYGSGLKFKVLEAFLVKTPVVATEVAVGGLEVVDGRDLFVANTPAEMAASVLKMLDSAALRRRVGEAGRRYVVRHHDLRMTTRQLLDYYELAREKFFESTRIDQEA